MTGFNFLDIDKSFTSQKLFRKLNLHVNAGDFVAVTGPSGCGKSTLLRLLAGLEKTDAGTIKFDSHLPRIAYVFQESNLIPWKNLNENVAFPLELEGKLSRAQITELVQKALTEVQLESASRLFPVQLSGGMKMRASIARALVTEPELLLLDEAFSALDEITRHQLQEKLRELWLNKKMTTLFVTHSLSEAVFLAERVLIMKNGQWTYDQKISLPKRTESLREQTSYHQEVDKLARVLRQ